MTAGNFREKETFQTVQASVLSSWSNPSCDMVLHSGWDYEKGNSFEHWHMDQGFKEIDEKI